MYKLFGAIVLLLFFSCKEKNITISQEEKVQLKQDIESYLKNKDSAFIDYKLQSIFDFKYDDLENKVNKRLAEELNINDFIYKADFDQNGVEDFLVIGDAKWCLGRNDESCSFDPLVILNYSQNDSKIILLNTKTSRYFVPKIEFKNGKDLMAIYVNEILDWKEETLSNKPSKKLLEYKFGNFIEYKSTEDYDYNIDKIEYQTSICFGTCPEFALTIDKNRNAIYKAINFNFSEEFSENNFEGIFKTKLREDSFNQIITLLNHIDFPYLKDQYHVDWTDDQTGTFKIYYNYGKIKEISDYGLQGTKGLELLHKTFFDLRENQDWEKIK